MEAPAHTLGATMPRKVPPASAFGEWLAEPRAERGGTQGRLAGAIASSQRATVAEFPPTAVVLQLAEALKVSTDELLGVKPLRAGQAAEDPEVRRLWKKFQQVLSLPEKHRRAVIRLVNSLVAAKAAR